MNQENIGKFIASLRKEKKLTQEQFAELLGVNNRSVSRWENGTCIPDLSLFQMIADELDVEVSELINGQRMNRDEYFIKEKAYMENYKILMETVRKEVFGKAVSAVEKQNIVFTLLQGAACEEDIHKYKVRMKVNPYMDKTYPNCYIPPYNANKKQRLVQGYLPKTNILYANHYELEILRLLFLYAPENREVLEMVDCTLQRLRNTCFGNSCLQGECVIAGISVLRFLAVTQPHDREWMERLLIPLGEKFLAFGKGQAAVQNGIPLSYLLMAFSDINNEKTKILIEQKKEWLLDLLRRGWITGKLSKGKISEGDSYNLLGKFILRSAICTLSDYEDVSKYEIYVNDKDERCYCNI